MPRGSKPGERRGGRSKGTPNGKTAEKVAAIEASGITPLDYMLRVMRDEGADEKRRDDMARAAAPFVHAKLSAIEMSGELAVHNDVDDKPLSESEWSGQNPAL